MKTLISCLALCIIVSQFAACKKEVTSPSNTLPANAGNIAGSFTVSSFVSAGNPTSVFSGFAFTFKENGTIVAAKGSDTFNGTWTFDDGNNTEIKITFPDARLNQLNKSWHITELTGDHLLLSDDNQNEDANDDHAASNDSVEFERD